ncbi:hypothetical protein BpHYR1_028738 [Brachionus plicatilis]|uniref:Uncharacterized protein n=1 Tax=Brachionus plicatilis TaxID=10195 RepID=A0A3M7QVP7_BRAPC|nr:hypothetical protein BpHYR1_028738 [Brachionus plicatilis]
MSILEWLFERYNQSLIDNQKNLIVFLGLMSTDNSDDSFLTVCKNAIRIRVSKNRLDIVNRLTILNSLKQIDNGSIIPFIKTVTTTKRNIWLISFSETYNFAYLTGHKISINYKQCTIEDAQYPEATFKSFAFKFVGLKPNFSAEKIAKHIISKGVEHEEIEKIYEEYFQEEEFKHISKDDEYEENFDNRIITETEVDDTNQNEAPTIASLIADFSLSKNDNMTVLGKSNKFYKRTFNDTSLNSNDQSENHYKQAKNDESVREVMSGSEAEDSIESNDDAEIKDGNSKYSLQITLPVHNETNSSLFDQQKQTADLVAKPSNNSEKISNYGAGETSRKE